MQAENLSVAIALGTMDLETPGQRIEAAIKHSGTTARALAKALETSEQVVSQIVNGARPGTKHMVKIAKLLAVPLEWIRFGEATNAPTWALRDSPIVAREINYLLAVENSRLRNEIIALKNRVLFLSRDHGPAISGRDGTTPVDDELNEAEDVVNKQFGPGSVQPKQPGQQPSRPRRRGRDGGMA